MAGQRGKEETRQPATNISNQTTTVRSGSVLIWFQNRLDVSSAVDLGNHKSQHQSNRFQPLDFIAQAVYSLVMNSSGFDLKEVAAWARLQAATYTRMAENAEALLGVAKQNTSIEAKPIQVVSNSGFARYGFIGRELTPENLNAFLNAKGAAREGDIAEAFGATREEVATFLSANSSEFPNHGRGWIKPKGSV